MMNELTAMALKNSFLKMSISEKDYLSSFQLHQVMNKLNGQPFDPQVFEELWDQCKLNSKGEAKLMDFIENIIHAESILIEKETDSESEIKKIQGQIRANNLVNDYNELKRLKDALLQAKQAKISARISMQILRKPFINFNSVLNSKAYSLDDAKNTGINYIPEQINNHHDSAPEQIVISTKQTLSWIVSNTLMLLTFELLMGFYIANYVSILALGITLSVFFFQFFSRKTFKMLFLIILFSIVVDSIWLVIHAKRIMKDEDDGQWPRALYNYIKICFYLCFGVIFGKVLLLCMLYSEFDIDQTQFQQYQICGAEFLLRNEFDATIANRNPIGYALNIESFRKQ